MQAGQSVELFYVVRFINNKYDFPKYQQHAVGPTSITFERY